MNWSSVKLKYFNVVDAEFVYYIFEKLLGQGKK